MSVNKKISDYLNSNGITQAFVSRETGISVPKLNLALNDKRKLSLTEYELICGALHVPVDTFLEARMPD